MKALITGHRGFVGKYLNQYLVDQGWVVDGFDGDIRDYETVRNTLDVSRPDVVFHLAAQAYVPESFQNPKRTFGVNTVGSLNILEAIRQLGIKTTIHLAGTSEEYGNGGPNEEDLPNPLSPYAISKLAMDHLGRLYAKSYGLHVVVTRAFNHTGPGRGEMYAESAFAKQIVEVELGRRKVVEHGNLESIRNYTDVRDMVRAYAEVYKLPSGVYNICSKENWSMQSVMNHLIRNSKARVKTEVNPSLYRPSDFSFKEPSCTQFQKLTGWKPQLHFRQTLKDILEDWRIKLA